MLHSVSEIARMKRELGLSTNLFGGTIPRHLPPDSIQQCIEKQDLSLVSYQPDCLNGIQFYWFAFQGSAFSDNELKELKKAYKRMMNLHKTTIGPFTREEIIEGIRWRRKKIFQNDPTYEKRVTEILDKFLIDFTLYERQRENQRVRQLIIRRNLYRENMKIPKKSEKALQNFNQMNVLLREIFLLHPRDPIKEIADALKNDDDVADYIRANKIL